MQKKNENKTFQLFLWEGINQQGVRVKGLLLDIHQEAVFSELRQKNIEPIKIRLKKIRCHFFNKVSSKESILICRHLATLILAGIPLTKSLEMIANRQNKMMTKILIQTIRHEIGTGKQLHIALANQKLFNPVFIELIKVGEQSGTLDIVLKRLVEFSEKSEILKKKIKKSLFYPMTICISSMLVVFLLLFFIVPRFENLFSSFAADLPWLTRQIIKLSRFFQHYWISVLSGTGIGSCCLMVLIKMKKAQLKNKMDDLILKIPILKKIIKLSIVAKLTRNLETLLSADTPLLDAFSIVVELSRNQIYKNSIFQIQASIAEGQQLHNAMQNSHLFPDFVVQMIAVGEESGNLPLMLEKIATHFEEELETIISNLTTLIEPMLMLLIGCFIGSFVLAMYLPIFKLNAMM